MDDAQFNAHRRATLNALSAYQRKGTLHIDQPTLSKMLSEESDRGIVIILGSFIEDQLMERIAEKLPGANEAMLKKMAKPGGPLKDATSKVTLAQALGVIDHEVADFLDIFWHMRNACAHSKQDINFHTQELKSALSLFFEGASAEDLLADDVERGMLRMGFVCAAGMILGILSGETREQALDRISEVMDEIRTWAIEQQLSTYPDSLADTPFLKLRWLPNAGGGEATTSKDDPSSPLEGPAVPDAA